MRIALIGSAPSSVDLAPYDDETWQIWGCSPGAHGRVTRVNAWFELHRWEPDKPWFPAAYVEWMAALPVPVFTNDVVAEIPSSVRYPREEMLNKFGAYFFTSSLSWMFALALSQPGVEEIGIWGVDMSATEEYGFQRAGCHFFIQLARSRGIKITIPPESDLDRPCPLYGIGETSPMRIKLMVRKTELEAKLADVTQRAERHKAEFEGAMREHHFILGAMEDLQYILNTWCDELPAQQTKSIVRPTIIQDVQEWPRVKELQNGHSD